MSCCGNNNNRNYYSRSFNHESGCCKKERCCDEKESCCNEKQSCCNEHDRDDFENNCTDLSGISCSFNNNNDCLCERSLRDAACKLTNQRVIIHTEGCKMCVVIVAIGSCFIKTINPCTQRIVYFNLNRIDNIEDVLPRC